MSYSGNDAREVGPIGSERVLQVHPTRHCNLACAHCYSGSGPAVREELESGLLARCLADAASLGYTQLAVSGGEPLLYAKLGDVLSEARRLGMVTSVTTNGILASRKRWEPLAPLVDVVAVSIDGTPEAHDALRRSRGAFERTIENLQVLRETDTAFGFIFTLTQYNVDSLEFVVQLAAEHGARSVQVHPLSLDGRAAELAPGTRPDGIELAVAILEAERLGVEFGVAVHVDAVTLHQLLTYTERFVPTQPAHRLTSVAPVLIVEAGGAVVPLTHELERRFSLGSLHEASLGALAQAWLSGGRANELAGLCAQAYAAMAGRHGEFAFYWYDEVVREACAERIGPRSETTRQRRRLTLASSAP